jgi:hypothetical protein
MSPGCALISSTGVAQSRPVGARAGAVAASSGANGDQAPRPQRVEVLQRDALRAPRCARRRPAAATDMVALSMRVSLAGVPGKRPRNG